LLNHVLENLCGFIIVDVSESFEKTT
jgi:hypothetical protein